MYSFARCSDEKVMADDEFTCDLFRFLQLLCEGHNNGKFLSHVSLNSAVKLDEVLLFVTENISLWLSYSSVVCRLSLLVFIFLKNK